MVALFQTFYNLHHSGHTTDLQLKFDHLYSFKERCLNIFKLLLSSGWVKRNLCLHFIILMSSEVKKEMHDYKMNRS